MSLILKIQSLAGEPLDVIRECLTLEEQKEAVSIYEIENDDFDSKVSVENAIDFILNGM